MHTGCIKVFGFVDAPFYGHWASSNPKSSTMTSFSNTCTSVWKSIEKFTARKWISSNKSVDLLHWKDLLVEIKQVVFSALVRYGMTIQKDYSFCWPFEQCHCNPEFIEGQQTWEPSPINASAWQSSCFLQWMIQKKRYK